MVFGCKERHPVLGVTVFRGGIWSDMAGIAGNLGGQALRIDGDIDHAHLLLRIPANINVADFIR